MDPLEALATCGEGSWRYQCLIEWTYASGSVSYKLKADFLESLDSGQKLETGATQRAALLSLVVARALRHVGTRRYVEPETFNPSDRPHLPDWSGDNFKSLLFAYKNDPSTEIQNRFRDLVERCSSPGFPIGELTVGIRGRSLFASTKHGGLVLDLEERSTGVQQLVFILALSLCHTGSILAIEEPELNLSTTYQRALWSKLQEFVGSDRPLRQIIVTSHSALFESQAERWTVRRAEDGSTIAVRAESKPVLADDVTPVHVDRGGSVFLPPSALGRLGIGKEGGDVFLAESADEVALLSEHGFAKLMKAKEDQQ